MSMSIRLIGIAVVIAFIIGIALLMRTADSRVDAAQPIRGANVALLAAALSTTYIAPSSTLATDDDNSKTLNNKNDWGERGVDPAIIKSKAWDRINFNSRSLINNVWGAPPGEKFTSAVYFKHDRSFGWYWDRENPKPQPGETLPKPLYPGLRIGGCPWESTSACYFPVKVGDVKTLELNVSYNYPSNPRGSYNLAYDIFLSDTDKAQSNPKPKAEVMIWLHHTFPQPQSVYKGDFTDGFNTYKLYAWVMPDGRLYYSFIKEGNPLNEAAYTINAKSLLTALELDPNWYIHGIELGNEILSGSGKIEITQFDLNLNGCDL
jgi:hypothetical protein